MPKQHGQQASDALASSKQHGVLMENRYDMSLATRLHWAAPLRATATPSDNSPATGLTQPLDTQTRTCSCFSNFPAQLAFLLGPAVPGQVIAHNPALSRRDGLVCGRAAASSSDGWWFQQHGWGVSCEHACLCMCTQEESLVPIDPLGRCTLSKTSASSPQPS